YVDSCAQFWMNALDQERGGFYTNIDRYGNVISAWGTNKNLLTQTRNVYGFSRAYMMTGDDIYREYAEAGLDFMYEHAWDDINGGWFSQLDINGDVIDATSNRSAFDEHYALLGPAAAFEVFGDSLDLSMLLQGYTHLEDVFWDNREGFDGYYDWATYSGSVAYDKSFNATVDAITTHLLSLYLQTEDQIYLDRLHQVCDQIMDHLVASMPAQTIGFVEEFDSNWNWDNGETMTIMGHVLKSAWCLMRVYHLDPRPEYLEAAELLAADVLDNGYDHDFGGPYKDYNRTTGEMLMWGNPDTAKAWWQMEQAITAGLELWSVTENDSYLQMADETLHFFMQHFVDHTYGDVYENRTRYGDQTWGLNKGGGGKAGYHSIETGYYTYIYGSLFFHNSPFSLYYWFETESVERTVKLNPIMSDSYPLSIESIQMNGEDYTGFEQDGRNLIIPADIGGEFLVTFIPSDQTSSTSSFEPVSIRLSPSFPNPFNAQTTFEFRIAGQGRIKIAVFNMMGQEVRSVLDEVLIPGIYQSSWDGRNQIMEEVPTGVYLIRLEQGSIHQTQKVLLLK
ncbi:AGE family epimerase/isomerase, partial [bacterium]|nr:AGE family epimerase/isomerase [bacterium]